ncbi:FAD-binding domain-containing protein [Thozetella sp. PMI_491]|nr:FAD-binding domain-containing protein [Thozetella sp. PMI_491]
MATSGADLPVLIIGGGIVGLTLAQALKKAKVPFAVYERDPDFSASEGGWGITVHWALPAFETCLPTELYDGLRGIQVDPQQGIKDTGRFVFLDLANAEPAYVIPPSERLRINRRKLRGLLSTGIDVQWGKNIQRFETQDSGQGGVTAHFEDGSSATGAVVVGADGSSSRTRRLLYAESDPSKSELYQLPIRFMGITMRLTPDQVKPLRSIDPLLFQGSHKDSGVFLWYSTLSTPEVNGSGSSDDAAGAYYEAQLNMSWPVKSEADEVPATNRERVAKMKEMAQPFEERLKRAIDEIPDDSEVLEIRLQDWVPRVWNNRAGRATLAGDAAHAMTMYRGEAFNHGITDAARLSGHLISAWNEGRPLSEAVAVYEEDMRERTRPAVLLSRQACLDAHDLRNLTSDSPLVSKRARVLVPAKDAN